MADVKFNVVVDEKGAVKKIEGVGASFDKAGGKSDALKTKMGGLRQSFGEVASLGGRIPPAMFGIAGAVAALGAGVFAATKQTIDLGSSLVDMSSKTGLSISSLQELKFVGEQTGVSFATITNAVQVLGRRAAADLPDAVKTLSALGLSVDQIVKSDPGTAFQLVADKIAAIPSPAEQAAAAMALFGRQGLEVLPAINQGLGENIERFRELGVTMSDETALAAKDLSDSLTDLDARWTSIKTTIGGAVIPVLVQLIDGFRALWNIILLGVSTAMVNLAKSFDVFALVPGRIGETFTGLADSARNMARELETGATKALGEIASEGTKTKPALASVSGGIIDIGNSAGTSTPKLSELQKKVLSLKDTLGGAGLSLDAQAATQAIQDLGGAGNLTVTGLESLSGLIENLRKNSMSLSPELAAVALELDKVALRRNLAGVIDDLRAAELTTEDWRAALEGIPPELDGIEAGINAAMGPDGQAIVGGVERKTIDLGTAMSGVNDFLSETRGLMTLLGAKADNVFGKIIGGISKVFDAFNSLTGIISKVAGLFGGGGGGLGGLFGGLFGGGGGTGLAGGLGGLGGILGAGAGAFFSNPFGLLAAGGLGAFFGLKGLFGRKGSAETTAESVGINFDALTQDLKDQIQHMGEELGSFASGLQLNLAGIFAQGGLAGGIDELARRAADSFSFLERGEFTEDQVRQALGQPVELLLTQFEQLGSEGTAQIERLLRASVDFGLTFSDQDKLVQQFASSVVSAAQQGGAAWLSATNSIGTSGRETLEFLIGAYGTQLPPAIHDSIAELLSLSSTLADAAASGSGDVNGLTGDMQDLASEQPGSIIGDDIATGIGAGVAVALSDIELLQRALIDLGATGINPPGIGSVPTPPVIGAQGGFFSAEPLRRDQLFQAHAGELVNIGRPSQFQDGNPRGGSASVGTSVVLNNHFHGTVIQDRQFDDRIVRTVREAIRPTSNRGGLRSEMRQNVR